MRAVLGVLLAALLAAPAAGEEGGGDRLLEETLPLRTALHQDPTLAAPLERLVGAWRSAGRLPELLAVYRQHLDSWPDDAAATVVWLRLLQAAGDPAAPAAVREAAGRFPVDAFLHHLTFQVLRDVRDPAALEALERAVNLERLAWRRRQWSAELVKEAVVQGRRDLALRHLRERAAGEERADALCETARAMAGAGFHEEALAALAAAQGRNPDPETLVEIELSAAAAEAALGRRPAAAARLDALAARLGPEHWRRPEVARRRLALAGDEGERERLLAGARERLAAPGSDEAALLDAARLLAGSGHRAEAIAGLRAALPRFGVAPRLEREIDLLFDLTRDEAGRAGWLAERLAADPARGDLAWRRVEALYRTGQTSAAETALEALAGPLAAPARADALAGLGRALHKAVAHEAAADCFRRALAADPARLALRRELGECLVTLGRRRQLRELFADPAAAAAARTVPAEALLEALPFCQRHGLLAEAAALAEARLAADPQQFEVLLAAARLARAADAEARAQARLLAARALADTPARYRAWLEALFDGELKEERVAALLDAEAGRLAVGEHDRLAALAELARGREQPGRGRALVERALVGAPPELLPALHRLQVACLEKLPERADELAAMLQRLAAEEPESRDEALVRLALLGDAEAAAAVPPDLTQVRDAALLASWYERQRVSGDVAAARAAAARLVELEPNAAERWRAWLALLAADGDEQGFRVAVRRLLAGVDRLRPAGAVRTLLARHLADSCWRQAVRALAKPEAAALDEALAAVAEVEAGDPAPGERAWLLWARALLAARSGRASLLAEARAALRPAAAAVGDRFELPDGMTIALAEAEARLQGGAPAPPPAAVPMRPWRADWVVRHREDVAGVVASGGLAVVIGNSGSLAAYELAGGRLRWALDGAADACGLGTDPDGEPQRRPPVLLLGDETVVVAHQGELHCRRVADGALRWRAPVSAAIACAARDGGRVLAVCSDPTAVVAVDLASGRRLWDWQPELPDCGPLPTRTAIDGTRILVLGGRSALLDAADRSVRWCLDPKRVRPVDVRLEGGEVAAFAILGADGETTAPASALAPAMPAATGDHRLVAPLAGVLADGAITGLELRGDTALVQFGSAGTRLVPLAMPGVALPAEKGTDLLGLVDGQVVGFSGGVLTLGAAGAPPGNTPAIASIVHREAAPAPPAEGEEEQTLVAAAALDGRLLWACTNDGIAAFALPEARLLMMAPFAPLQAAALTAAEAGNASAHLAHAGDALVVAFGANLVGLHAPAPGAGAGLPFP